MRAMRAREVSPEEAPELHGMIDRLCALADMPKPRVGIADLAIPNAFATGRSPERAVVCVTTGIMGKLTPEELEAVLAHELSHVAHRDVLVMTVASSAGIVAGMLTRGAQFGALVAGGREQQRRAPTVPGRARGQPRRLRHQLLPAPGCCRATASCAPTGRGAYLTMKPAALASALQKITGEIATIPQRDLRAVQGDERVLHRPGDQRRLAEDAHLDPPLAGAAARAAGPDPGRARPAHREAG